jgi:hypothetical protein
MLFIRGKSAKMTPLSNPSFLRIKSGGQFVQRKPRLNRKRGQKDQMKLVQKTWILPSAILSLALSFTSKALADSPSDYLHSRTYIGVVATSVSVGTGGEFSGLNYSRIDAPAYEVDLIPAIRQNFGYGLLIGHREEAWSGELSFWQSNHTATFGPGTFTSPSGQSTTLAQQYQGTATYNSVNVDFKRYFFTEQQLQPFLNLGVSFPWIVVNNGAIDGNGNITNLTLAGLGLNLGLGAEYYLTPNISFVAGAYQRWASFDEFKGAQLQYNQIAQFGNGNPTSDEGSGLIFAVGTTLGFE